VQTNYSEKKQKEIENFINLQYINIEIEKHKNMFNNIVAQNLDFLNMLANDSSSVFQLSAWGMLEQAGYKEKYREIVKLPNLVVADKSMAIENKKTLNNNYNNLESLFKVFPNPADDYITVQFAIIDFSQATKLTLSDMHGKTIKQIELQNQIGEIRIDVSNLEKGIYILSCGNNLFSKKININ